jgi:hypothetical protein
VTFPATQLSGKLAVFAFSCFPKKAGTVLLLYQSVQYVHIYRNGEIMETARTENLSPRSLGDPCQAELPIAIETTPNERTQTSQRPNKYVYPVFDGFSGERYLDSIIQKILPNALSRTWRYAVEHQAPGRDCYVGAAKIADRVKPGVRKIEIDLHELEVRGLMRRYPARRPFLLEDGSFVERAVIVKDFKALYDLAYEYHLWTQSPEYIPPEREYADLILADQKLYQKLTRFDNYRRLLCCDKPGRKSQLAKKPYQCQLPQDGESNGTQQRTGTSVQDTNNYLNTSANSSSLYRITPSEENGLLNESKLRDASASNTKRNDFVNQSETVNLAPNPIGKGLYEKEEETQKGKQPETGQKIIEGVNENRSIENQRTYEIPRQTAKESKMQKTGDIMRGMLGSVVPASHMEELARRYGNGTESSKKQEPKQRKPVYVGSPLTQEQLDQRKQLKQHGLLREVPVIPPKDTPKPEQQQRPQAKPSGKEEKPQSIQSNIELFSRLLHDESESVPQNVNRAYKLYQLSQRSEDAFTCILYEAFHAAERKQDIAKKNSDGRANKMPWFFTVLEQRLGLREKPQKQKGQ